ncbi:hypothetical protein BpHYR1_010288 [Brachionus plicatilis]|uniref:RNA-directed DNA polymerase from mobile element jockey-like n=1 Tax=Brachionus plicatilis TaxID=10195 RepID=A0A3M7S309_BRAPC|nr:hypothetical protein BpHYR1_010288 [Brachionus plicatilis]
MPFIPHHYSIIINKLLNHANAKVLFLIKKGSINPNFDIVPRGVGPSFRKIFYIQLTLIF